MTFPYLLVGYLFSMLASVQPPVAPSPTETPLQVAQSLLAADRAFSLAAANADAVAALSAMFSDGVVMPTPGGSFAMGKAAVVTALRASPRLVDARVTWTPIRAGISADGLHGFTFGYMTVRKADASTVPAKYMAYWARAQDRWRVVAYKQAGAPSATADTTLMPFAVPSTLQAPGAPSAIAGLRHELMNAENTFSREAQQIGLGNAFAKFGLPDAVNMGGGGSSTFVVSAARIAQHVGGGDMTSSTVVWGADTAFVASSGDLGITFGVIRPKGAAPSGAQSGVFSFFTIWSRANASGPWRYIAE